MEYVDGSKAKPVGSPNLKAVKDFMKRSAEAHMEIILYVEVSQLAHVCDPDPTSIWSTLETIHCAHGFATRLMLCRRFLTLCKSDEMSICQDQFFTDLISTRGLGVRGWPSGKTEVLRSVVALPE